MSSPLNDAVDQTRVVPVMPDVPGGSTESGTQAATQTPRVRDPLKTLEYKPQIVNVLSTIFDPEIPVNIYELGLIYDVVVDAQGSADIRMTLTAPGCPAAQSLPIQVEQRVRDIPGITDVHVDVVWEPPWTKDCMSESARLQLGIF